MWSLIPWLGRSPGGGSGNPLQYFCLENPWTEKPSGPQSIGLQRVEHDWSDLACMHARVNISCTKWKWTHHRYTSKVDGSYQIQNEINQAIRMYYHDNSIYVNFKTGRTGWGVDIWELGQWVSVVTRKANHREFEDIPMFYFTDLGGSCTCVFPVW